MLSAASGGAVQAADVTMFRSPSCGCCLEWLEHMREYWTAAGETGEVKPVSTPDMQSVKWRAGVPADLSSCHTTLIDGYVIEGHVPAADVARLLKQRPEGVRGLAVAGMPIGSPGMEYGDRQQAYDVVAFGPAGRTVWSSYPASGS
ncbi:DUF411 domain-containing protein [Erythrobacter sp. WH131]|uniref:DUF411 domain-containing protein n=2 Tax=Erythrobacter ani TaxID=2827235 RepID=A0ABS6SMA1_9SPHN|nr:DUF411 domain-containing protein [Erythrobacter ani]